MERNAYGDDPDELVKNGQAVRVQGPDVLDIRFAKSANNHCCDVTLDAGHGDNNASNSVADPGAMDGDHAEKDYALKLVYATNAYLQIMGISTEMTRNDDINVDPSKALIWRWKIANANGSQVFVSFHLNSGSKNRAFAVYQQGKSNEKASMQLGSIIMDKLSTLMNTSKDAVVPASGYTRFEHLGILNNFSGSAGVLIEFGGIGSSENRENIDNNSMNIGYQVARGIYMYINGKEPDDKIRVLVPPLR
jgi:N-acetylmuramoyl-L-alanine amidase